MDKNKIDKDNITYIDNKYVSQCAFFADMNYPSRKYMEDRWIVPGREDIQGEEAFFVVLDGHGGTKAVEFCKDNLQEYFNQIYKPWKSDIPNIFTKVFQKIDEKLLENDIQDTGSTCCVCFIRSEKDKPICYLGNMGDTKAILVSFDNNKKAKVVSETIEHKGTNLREQERVKQAGGTIIQNRVSGSLSVTRALGDLDLKKEGVINIPDVSWFQLNKEDKYLIMASDGLWDIITDVKMEEIITKATAEKMNLDKLAEKLVKEAKDGGTKDNTTILIIELK